MARSKKSNTSSNDTSSVNVDSLITEMQMELDQAVNKMVGLDEDIDSTLLSTGIDVLDMILGGGIGINRLTTFVGDPGTFKSTLTATICGRFQKSFDKSLILYLDSENSMSRMRLQQMGLDNVVPKVNLTVEKIFATIQALMAFKEEHNLMEIPTIVVWDSIANTPTDAELAAKSVNETIGLKARIISNKLPVIINKLKEYNITLQFINQFRDKVNIGMFSPASDLKHMSSDKTTPGGNSAKFNASQFLQLRVSRILQQDTSPYGFRATIVKVKTVKNKFFPDGYECELVVDPTRGINNLYTNWEFLKSEKQIVSSAWSYLKDYPNKKLNGIKKLEYEYQADKNFRDAFDKILEETIKEKQRVMTNDSLDNYIKNITIVKPINNTPTTTSASSSNISTDDNTGNNDNKNNINNNSVQDSDMVVNNINKPEV